MKKYKWSIALYGSESWTLEVPEKRNIGAFKKVLGLLGDAENNVGGHNSKRESGIMCRKEGNHRNVLFLKNTDKYDTIFVILVCSLWLL